MVISGQDPTQLDFHAVESRAYAAKEMLSKSELTQTYAAEGSCSMHTVKLGSFGHVVSGFKDTGGKLWNLTLWLKGTEASVWQGSHCMEVKPGLSWRPRMVELRELRDTCKGELQTGCGTNPREVCSSGELEGKSHQT